MMHKDYCLRTKKTLFKNSEKYVGYRPFKLKVLNKNNYINDSTPLKLCFSFFFTQI